MRLFLFLKGIRWGESGINSFEMKNIRIYSIGLLLMVGVIFLSGCGGGMVGEVVDASPRALQVVSLSPVDAPELWRVPVIGGEALQLTDTGGQVYDFAVSRAGDWIAYSTANETVGHDLWLIDTASGELRKLLDCAEESCIEASWSADEAYLAFTRRNRTRESVWIVNRESGAVTPLVADGAPAGHSPSWSPDGRRVAFVESQSNRIRIVDLEGGEQFLLPGDDGLMGNWSPDGERMVFLDTANDSLFGGVDVYIADLLTKSIEQLALPEFDDIATIVDTGEAEHGDEIDLTPGRVDASVPVWHPVEELLLLAQRPYFATFSKQLWLMPLAEGAEATAVTSDHNFSHGAYRWAPDGELVVYQRFALEFSDAVPQVWVWDREAGEARLLIENAALPQWLP
jgi:dipeptidyl aminopeptidase/acylaminoacyl peptidase